MNDPTIAAQLANQSADMRAYQNLKESHDREVDATNRLFESLRRKYGNREQALVELKARGFNAKLLK